MGRTNFLGYLSLVLGMYLITNKASQLKPRHKCLQIVQNDASNFIEVHVKKLRTDECQWHHRVKARCIFDWSFCPKNAGQDLKKLGEVQCLLSDSVQKCEKSFNSTIRRQKRTETVEEYLNEFYKCWCKFISKNLDLNETTNR